MTPVLTNTSLFSSGSYSIWNTIWGLAAFAALIVLSFIVLRWISKRTVGASSGHMKVLERLPVGQGTYIMLVKVGQRVLALSANKDSMTFLCELPLDDIDDDPRTEHETASPPSGFAQRFTHNMRIQMGLLPKDTPPARPDTAEPTPRQAAERAAQAIEALAKDIQPSAPAAQGAFALALEKAANKQEFVPEDNEFLRLMKEANHQSVQEEASREPVADYNTAIESMKQLGRIEQPPKAVQVPPEERIAPIAPRAAAASYKTAAAPPVREKADMSPPAPKPPEIEDDASEILQALNERRKQPAEAEIMPETESLPEAAPPVTRRSERAMAAEKLRSDDKVDELFDKISQRSSRYGRSKKE